MPFLDAYCAGPALATTQESHALSPHGHGRLRSSPRPMRADQWRNAWGKQSGSMAVAFDEMNIPGGDLRPAYQELARWLKETPPHGARVRRAWGERHRSSAD